jgi:hypothetical protein
MSELRLAACGIDCSKCAQYKITVERDFKEAETLVDWFKSQGWIGADDGVEAVLEKSPLCKGCWNITNDCFWKCGCGSLDFRVCCNEKNIEHCGECADFPCEHYKVWMSWHEIHEKAMQHLLSLREKKRD